jgi:hypothetical protein
VGDGLRSRASSKTHPHSYPPLEGEGAATLAHAGKAASVVTPDQGEAFAIGGRSYAVGKTTKDSAATARPMRTPAATSVG